MCLEKPKIMTDLLTKIFEKKNPKIKNQTLIHPWPSAPLTLWNDMLNTAEKPAVTRTKIRLTSAMPRSLDAITLVLAGFKAPRVHLE